MYFFFFYPQYIHMNYGENPENYSESLKRLEQLRQVGLEGAIRRIMGNLHYTIYNNHWDLAKIIADE